MCDEGIDNLRRQRVACFRLVEGFRKRRKRDFRYRRGDLAERQQEQLVCPVINAERHLAEVAADQYVIKIPGEKVQEIEGRYVGAKIQQLEVLPLQGRPARNPSGKAPSQQKCGQRHRYLAVDEGPIAGAVPGKEQACH